VKIPGEPVHAVHHESIAVTDEDLSRQVSLSAITTPI
jgi:hypothetical protein